MKWTLMVGTCLLAFAFSPPASARHAAKEPQAAPYARHAPGIKHRSARVGSGDGSIGVATWYKHAGMTAAHRTLPFGTHVRVTNLSNGRSVVVRINDRGPFGPGKTIDVSDSAARSLGMIRAGVARVSIHVI
jgi:rare lipoprotein A